jgi:hypothetical protein
LQVMFHVCFSCDVHSTPCLFTYTKFSYFTHGKKRRYRVGLIIKN